MENIIQQITLELVAKINEKAFSKELTDLDRLAADLFEDCTEYAKLMVRKLSAFAIFSSEQIRHFANRKAWCLKKKSVLGKSSQS